MDPDPYEDLYSGKEAYLLQVTEKAILLMYPDFGGTMTIGFTYEQWDILLNAVAEMKLEARNTPAAIDPALLKMPNFSEIDFKNFPK